MNIPNGSQLHLAVNHFPVLLPLIGALVLAAGIILKSFTVRNVGLCLIVFAGIFAIPAFLTGEPAEHVVKNYPGTNRNLIHQHQRAANTSLILIEVVAVLSLTLLIVSRLRPNVPLTFSFVLLILSLGAFAHIANTAHMGGEIRHEEIRGD